MKYLISTFILLVNAAFAVPAIPTNAVTAETVTVLYNTNRVASLGPSNAVTLINSMIRTNATVTGISNAVVVLQSNTNNWNTAYGWGNHFGLYRLIDWVPGWNDVTNKPSTFAPAPHDYTSITNPPWATTNYTDAVAAGKVGTNDPAYLAACTGSVYYAGLTTFTSNRVVWIGTNAFAAAAQTNVTHNSLLGIEGAGTLHVSVGQTNLIKTAWQNPSSATNWTWTSDGTQITLTGYTGPDDVVMPKELDGLPVTRSEVQWPFPSTITITSITGSILFEGIVEWNSSAIHDMPALKSVSFTSITNIGQNAFSYCPALTAVYFGQNAMPEAEGVYFDTPNVTNYVTSSTATGWGATWCGRPVVRLPLYTDELRVRGTNVTDMITAATNPIPSWITSATNATWIATTNAIQIASNGCYVLMTNALTGATNSLWIAFTNYKGFVSTTDPAYLAACTGSVYFAGLTTYVSNRVTYIGTNAFTGGSSGTQTNVAHNSLLAIEGAGTLHVSAAETNRIEKSLQFGTSEGKVLLSIGVAGYDQGIGSVNDLVDPSQNPAAGYLFRYVDGLSTKYTLYDSGNFASGTHYLSPTGNVASVKINGTNLTTLLDGKVATNDTRVVNALTNFNDAIHGTRGGLNLHALADANGAGFYSADHYKAVESMKGRTNAFEMAVAHTNRSDNPHAVTPAQIGAVSNTPAGIAAAGGIVTNSIPGPGCTDLGATPTVTITGLTVSQRAAPTGVYTVSVAQAASRYTYALEVVSTNPCTLAAGLNLQGSWTITGTNILAIVPCTGTLWRVYGRGL